MKKQLLLFWTAATAVVAVTTSAEATFESSKMLPSVVLQGTAFKSPKVSTGIVTQGTAFKSPKLSTGVVVQGTAFKAPKISVGIVVQSFSGGGGVIQRVPLTHW